MKNSQLDKNYGDMGKQLGPELASVREEVARRQRLAKDAGQAIYYVENGLLIEELPDGRKLISKGPAKLKCATKPSPAMDRREI